jgi:hypothetical protein
VKRNILISIFILAFSVIFFFVSSRAKAEPDGDSKKDLVSILHLQAAGLGLGSDSDNGKDRQMKPLREVLVPFKEGLKTFVDFTSPWRQSLTPKDTHTEFRAVFGLRFPLK